MSERELNRIDILGQLCHGKIAAEHAANVLGMSVRHARRLKKQFEADGPASVSHKARGRLFDDQF